MTIVVGPLDGRFADWRFGAVIPPLELPPYPFRPDTVSAGQPVGGSIRTPTA